MNHHRSLIGLLGAGLIILSLAGCGGPAAPPEAGTYSGTLDDGSSLSIVLVMKDDQIQVKELGFCLYPIHTEVKRIFLPGVEAFGEVAGNTLTFQLPIQLPVMPAEFKYFDVELKWNKPGEIRCTLKTSPEIKDEYLDFQMQDLNWGAYKEGGDKPSNELEDQYELVLMVQ